MFYWEKIKKNLRCSQLLFLAIITFSPLSVLSCNKNVKTDTQNISDKNTENIKNIEEKEQRKPVDLSLSLAAKPRKDVQGSEDYVKLINYFSPNYDFEEADSILLPAASNFSQTQKAGGKNSENHIPGLRKLSEYITKYNPINRSEKSQEQLSKKYLHDENAEQTIEKNNEQNYETLPVIYNVFGGFSEKDDFSYSDETGAIPEYENIFYIKLNIPVSQEYLKENLLVSVDNKQKSFSLKPDYNHIYYSFWYPQNSDEKHRLCDSYIVTIDSKIGNNKIVNVKLQNPKASEWNSAISEANKSSRLKMSIEKNYQYKTLTKFKVLQFNENTGSSKGKSKPIQILFSQIPDETTIIENIQFDFDCTLTKDNYELNGRTLTLFNLPIDYGEGHTIKIKNGFKDLYGQTLYFSRYFNIPDEPASVQFLDYGMKMMEAQFPHKLVFSHRNVNENSGYLLSSTKNPFALKSTFETDKAFPSDTILLEEPDANVRYYEDIDLNPFLNDEGFGSVKFQASVNFDQYNSWSEKFQNRTVKNVMTVQVTDLGVTARIGINKAVLMVRSLSTGKPVSDAEVSFYYAAKIDSFEEFNSENRFASGKTDSSGVLEIDFSENEVNAILHPESTGSVSENENYKFLIKVQNGKDSAIFSPNTHNLWRESIETGNIRNVTKPKQKTFIFVDRGLYKPGETVSWRGIDKNLRLGNYENASGDYSIEIYGSWWKSSKIGETITGTLSSSGGFSGSFKLPDDLKPGYYEIRYLRKNESDASNSGAFVTNKNNPVICSFQVAEFEKVKTQIAINIPEMTYFGGDKINAAVKAEYLAGGALSNANFQYNWYTQGTQFTTDESESKEYSFGPYNSYSSRTYYSGEEGKLSSAGTLNAVCNSKAITDGKTYTYRLETAVTDVSNQRVSAVKTVTVHPAHFYIGLKSAGNISGFAKKGENLEFPYILTDTNGKILTAEKLSAAIQKLEYTLSHEEWTLVHEQSVDNTIYTRYSKTDIIDSEGEMKIESKGNLTLSPNASGWYTLKISGNDTKNNHAETSIRFYVTGNNTFFYNKNNSQGINLTTDKKEYLPGDTAKVLMESPLPKGDYLITVEREGIFASEIRHIEEPTDIIEVPVSKTFVPVVYLTVSSYSERNGEPVHNFGQPDLDKPKQYFGAATLFVNPYTRAFNLQIETDKAFYKPGEEVTLTLKATKNGKPLSDAELTVMAVDRGVLDVINYHVQNPISFFYSSYNFEDYVSGGDSRSFLMDPVTYSIKDLQGGDSDETKDDERKDFRPTALFEPVVITDKQGTATVKFILPDTLTTYRITAFGVKNDLFALQENETRVQNPVNVQAVQPEKLRVSDTAECGVLLTNLTNQTQEVTVSVEAKTPAADTFEDKACGRRTIPGKAFIDGNNKCSVSVISGDSSVVYFDVAAENEGTVELVYTIESGALNEKLISPVKIEKTYIYETQVVSSEADDENKISFAIPSAAENSRGDLSITLDATRLGSLNSAVNYLFDYPYDSLEQNAERVLPLIIFGKYIDIFDLNTKVSDISTVVSSALKDLGKNQLSDGGFPYWSNDNSSSFYVSLRIAHLYALALQNGYSSDQLGIKFNMLSSYIAKETPKIKDDYLKAYACYVLKLNGENKLDYVLNQLMANYDKMDLSASALTGICFAMNQSKNSENWQTDKNHENALKIAENIRHYVKQNAKSVSVLENPYADYWKWYNSDSGELAAFLQLFTMLDSSDQINDKILYSILLQQKKGYWKNTASTARVLEAVSTFISYRNLENTDFTAAAKIGEKEVLSAEFSGAGAKPVTLKLPFEEDFLKTLEKDKEYPVTFSKKGTGHLYYTLKLDYALPSEMQIAVNNGIDMNVEISDYETGKVLSPKENKSVLELESGKIYKAVITLASPVQLNYLALRSPVPSGCEILDPSFATTGTEAEIEADSKENYAYYNLLSNKIIYSNEIQFFWDNFERGSSTVSFTFRAVRRGVYSLPPVFAQCMYEEDIYSQGDGWICTIK